MSNQVSSVVLRKAVENKRVPFPVQRVAWRNDIQKVFENRAPLTSRKTKVARIVRILSVKPSKPSDTRMKRFVYGEAA